MSGFVISEFVILGFFILGFRISGFVISGFVLSRFVIFGFVISGFIISRFVISRFFILRFVKFRFVISEFVISAFCYQHLLLVEMASYFVLFPSIIFITASDKGKIANWTELACDRVLDGRLSYRHTRLVNQSQLRHLHVSVKCQTNYH